MRSLRNPNPLMLLMAAVTAAGVVVSAARAGHPYPSPPRLEHGQHGHCYTTDGSHWGPAYPYTRPPHVEPAPPQPRPPLAPPTEPAPIQPQEVTTPAPMTEDFLASTMGAAAAAGVAAPNMIGDFFGGVLPIVEGVERILLSGNFTAIFVDAVDVGPAPLGQRNYEHPLGGQVIIINRDTGEQILSIHDYPTSMGPLQQTAPIPVNTFMVNEMSSAASFAIASQQLAQLIPGAVLLQLNYNVNAGRVEFGSGAGLVNLEYDGNGLVEIQLPVLLLLPAGARPGAQIGQLKVSDNNSALPQDRFIFNYRHFSNVPLSASGMDVNRFNPGFEKTLFGRRASVQMTFPFASTLASTSMLGTVSKDTEFGNMQLITKYLAMRRPTWMLGMGLGIELPTADDLGVGLTDGTPLIRISNDAVHLQPYMAHLYTPGDGFFVQTFVLGNVDVSGNRVDANADLGGLVTLGRLYTLPQLLIDMQFGYWWYRDESGDGPIAAVNSVFEIHYNQAFFGPSNSLSVGNLIARNLLENFSIVNLTLGTTIQFRNDLELLLGLGFPVSSDRSDDVEFAALFNYYFGPSATRRNGSPSF